jgi:hypothetical protein
MDGVELIIAIALLTSISLKLTAACALLFPLYGILFGVILLACYVEKPRCHYWRGRKVTIGTLTRLSCFEQISEPSSRTPPGEFSTSTNSGTVLFKSIPKLSRRLMFLR